jgi:WD40 repeat protein
MLSVRWLHFMRAHKGSPVLSLSLFLVFFLLRAISPVHVTKWALDNVHIFSSSDDKTVRYWDLPTEKEIQIMKGHQVRCLSHSLAS